MSVAYIALVPPQQSIVRARLQLALDRSGLPIASVPQSDAERYMQNENTKAYAIFGDHSWQQMLGGNSQVETQLRGKAVYRFGGSAESESRALISMGLAAFLGYRRELSLVLPSEPGAATAFIEPFIAGLRALYAGEDLKTARRSIAASWRTIANTLAFRSQNRGLLMKLFAHANQEGLFLDGDSSWRLAIPPKMVIFDTPSTKDDDQNREQGDTFADALRAELRPRDLTARIEVIDISPQVLQWLQTDPERVRELPPDKFEDLIANRLRAMNLRVEQVGTTFTPDGGIDFLAVPNGCPIPYLLAVQVKHSRRERAVSVPVVQRMSGIVASHPIDVGLIVTNTRFTEVARWAADQAGKRIRLRDFTDVKRWLQNRFHDVDVYDELPRVVRVTPDLAVPVPRPRPTEK